jgi:hypothetical protein
MYHIALRVEESLQAGITALGGHILDVDMTARTSFVQIGYVQNCRVIRLRHPVFPLN